MRDVNATVLTQLQAEEFTPFVLLHMTIAEKVWRFTDCDVPINIGGDSYKPRDFKVGSLHYSMTNVVDKLDVEIDDNDSLLKALFVGETPQGSAVILYLVLLDADNNVYMGTAGRINLFEGELDAWGLNEERIKITITSGFVKWNQRTLSPHSPSCRWKIFKGIECQYSGTETWCDRTYERCSQLVNTDNFGGFRFLPSLEDAIIYWGNVREVTAKQPNWYMQKG